MNNKLLSMIIMLISIDMIECLDNLRWRKENLDYPEWSSVSKNTLPEHTKIVNKFWFDIEDKMREPFKDLIPLNYRTKSNHFGRLIEIEVACFPNNGEDDFRMAMIGVYGTIPDYRDPHEFKYELRYVGNTDLVAGIRIG